MPTKRPGPIKELQSQIAQLQRQMLDLLNQVKQVAPLNPEGDVADEEGEEGEVIAQLHEPKSYLQLMSATEIDYEVLIHRLDALEKAGKVERWYQPVWIRSDVPEWKKGEMVLEATPLKEKELELLIARRFGRTTKNDSDRQKASYYIQSLKQKNQGFARLGDSKGAHWGIPPARGTRDNSEEFDLAKGTVGSPADGDQGDDTQYRLHRPRRGRTSEAPPTQRARGRRDET